MEFNKHYVKLALGATLIGLLVAFIFQNMAVVELQLLFWSVGVRRSLMILSVFTTGIIIGWLLCGARRR